MSKKEWTGEPYGSQAAEGDIDIWRDKARELHRKLDLQEDSYDDAVKSYEKLRMSHDRLQCSYDCLFDHYCARGNRIVELTEQITALKQERDDLAAMQSEPEPEPMPLGVADIWIDDLAAMAEPKPEPLCPACGALMVKADHGFKFFSLLECPVCDK